MFDEANDEVASWPGSVQRGNQTIGLAKHDLRLNYQSTNIILEQTSSIIFVDGFIEKMCAFW